MQGRPSFFGMLYGMNRFINQTLSNLNGFVDDLKHRPVKATEQILRVLGIALAVPVALLSVVGLFAIQGLGAMPAWQIALAICGVAVIFLGSWLLVVSFIYRQFLLLTLAISFVTVTLSLAITIALLANLLRGDPSLTFIFTVPHILFFIWLPFVARHRILNLLSQAGKSV